MKASLDGRNQIKMICMRELCAAQISWNMRFSQQPWCQTKVCEYGLKSKSLDRILRPAAISKSKFVTSPIDAGDLKLAFLVWHYFYENDQSLNRLAQGPSGASNSYARRLTLKRHDIPYSICMGRDWGAKEIRRWERRMSLANLPACVHNLSISYVHEIIVALAAGCIEHLASQIFFLLQDLHIRGLTHIAILKAKNQLFNHWEHIAEES